MNKEICIKKICSLPLDFKTGNKSASTLASESQFFIFHKDITPKDVEQYLTNHIDLIDSWKEWSENRLTDHGMYITLTENEKIIGLLDEHGQKVFEKPFDTVVEACAEYILRELIEIVILGQETNHEMDFDVIINASIEIGNLMQGQPIPESSQIIYYAEGLGQKIINHTLTVRYLLNGYQLGDGKNLFEPKIDYASIIVLTRAALETYLALNYVFIAENNEELKQFRFLCWDLAGYIERRNMQAQTEEHVSLKQNEAKSIEIIKNKLADNSIFKALPEPDQKKALKGEWRLNFKWHDLAKKAGFSEPYFRQQYKFLCSYAHASRLSVIQIQQNKTFEQQKEMATASISTLMVVLAKHMHDYIEVMPQLKAIKNDLTKYPIILFWKNVGDKLL